MKRLFFLLTTALLFVTCTDYNTPQQRGSRSISNDEYYVRYTIKSSWYVFGNVTYADVDGTKSDLTGRQVTNWTVTIGPVKKGFSAWSKNKVGTNTKSANHTIEVSKNNSPFVQKATGVNSASYTINF